MRGIPDCAAFLKSGSKFELQADLDYLVLGDGKIRADIRRIFRQEQKQIGSPSGHGFQIADTQVLAAQKKAGRVPDRIPPPDPEPGKKMVSMRGSSIKP